jgi:hypothetical protein
MAYRRFGQPNSCYGQFVRAKVSAESIIARDPQLIVLADAYQPYSPQTPAMLAARAGWSTITAVQNDAVYAVQEALFASPSPRLADGLKTLAYLMHPDRFASAGGPHLMPLGGIAPYCAAGQVPMESTTEPMMTNANSRIETTMATASRAPCKRREHAP